MFHYLFTLIVGLCVQQTDLTIGELSTLDDVNAVNANDDEGVSLIKLDDEKLHENPFFKAHQRWDGFYKLAKLMGTWMLVMNFKSE